MKKKLGIAAMLLGMVTAIGLSGSDKAAAEEGAASSTTESGVTVTIATDKTEYLAGEEIHYTITLENNRPHYKIDSFTFKYSNTNGLTAKEGTELVDRFPIIGENASHTIEGILVGDVEKFPADTAVTPGPGKEQKAEEQQKAGGQVSTALLICAALCGVAAVAVCAVKKKRGKQSGKKDEAVKGLAVLILAGLLAGMVSSAQTSQAAQTADYETVTLRPYVKVIYAGHEVMIRAVLELHMVQQYQAVNSAELDNPKKITCHDPSIFRDFDGTYYIFGSFLAGGYTHDLKNWTSIEKEFQASFTQEVRNRIKEWNADSTANGWNGYLWAPDIIYNTAMNKYCMYLSANGDNWKSNIVLLTADKVDGPYDYAGTIVYGGFTAEDYDQTDVALVTGEDTIPERYVTYGVKNKKWGDMYPNCIDPCVFYDDDGNLRIIYGSWSGGIFMLELDEQTGLRDYSVSYELNQHSDTYFGKKIAGGAYVSGEGAYIQKIGEYYYLFISYGNLEANGGYNVRIFRSKNPEGEYLDALGNDAFSDEYIFNYNISKGVRLFGGYKWRSFTYGQVAQGHNSAFVDADGKAYIVFHTRTTNGTEYHYVKVHQLFTNKEGWLVAAPYQTSGETLKQDGYSMQELAGEYEIILHNLNIEYKKLETNKPKTAMLNADGSITGEYTGTWSVEAGTPYIVLTIDGVNYSGVALEMNVENTTIATKVFTALGDSNQLTIWGSRSFE